MSKTSVWVRNDTVMSNDEFVSEMFSLGAMTPNLLSVVNDLTDAQKKDAVYDALVIFESETDERVLRQEQIRSKYFPEV